MTSERAYMSDRTTSAGETSDDWPWVIVNDGLFRVVMARSRDQWIVQRRISRDPKQSQYRSLSFCATLDGLHQAWPGEPTIPSGLPALAKDWRP